jgi:hypothetical protein
LLDELDRAESLPKKDIDSTIALIESSRQAAKQVDKVIEMSQGAKS